MVLLMKRTKLNCDVASQMKTSYPIQWMPATPEYILAYIQEEWRRFAAECHLPATESKKHIPTFATTIQAWCDEEMLDEWMELGTQLNQTWETNFTRKQWRQVLKPAHEKTLRDACELLATRAQRPVISPAKIFGRECKSAGIFLAIRSLLIEAGAPANLRPSSRVEPYLKKRPKIFLRKIDRLILGGLPYASGNKFWTKLTAVTCVVGALLLGVGCFLKESPKLLLSASSCLPPAGWAACFIAGRWRWKT